MNELAILHDKIEPAADAATVLPMPDAPPKPLHEIDNLDDYLVAFGPVLGRKAIESLKPLHVPGQDPLPDFSDIPEGRQPFDCQANAIAASVKMLDKMGSGFICGEMGVGKTVMGMLAFDRHARRPRSQGGMNGKYRALILAPDHLLAKWAREIRDTIPDAKVVRFGPTSSVEPGKKRRKKGEATEMAGTRQALHDVLRLLEAGTEDVKLVESTPRSGRVREAPVCVGDGEAEDKPIPARPCSGKAAQRRKRWKKPEGPEWYILGRNQAKWLSNWSGVADPRPGFSGETRPTAIGRTIVTKSEYLRDQYGAVVCDADGKAQKIREYGKVFTCPKCGTILRDEKGKYMSEAALRKIDGKSKQNTCRALVAHSVHDPETPKIRGNDFMFPASAVDNRHGVHRIPGRYAEKKSGDTFKHNGVNWVVSECGERLYQYTPVPYRWAPARIIQKQLKGLFQYLAIDEVHEQKSDEAAQSMACGKILASCRHVLGLTGTIIGGYANHLYPLMMRINPKTLIEEGFEWGKDLEFSKIYGKLDYVVTTSEGGGTSVDGRAGSMRKSKGQPKETKYVRPGIMPSMFGRHLIANSMFITLEEMAEELPDLFEYVGGPMQPEPERGDFSSDEAYEDAMHQWNRINYGWVEVACEMEPTQKDEYNRVAAELERANAELIQKGSMKSLGAYLWTTMDYPDKPFGWGHPAEVISAVRKAHAKTGDADEAVAKILSTHTVGYWNEPGIRTESNWVGVVTPRDCPEDAIYPKEQALIDICLKAKGEGTQAWVYVNMTNKRNIQPRLKKLLEDCGLRVGILRAGDVDPKEREEWIIANGREFDVMISHPQLVSTGLDLFTKTGHNYSTIVFYETGYNLFTMRQASRRSWRIGQRRDCRVYYLYYKETMQHKAMQLMSKKMAAAQALEGEFSADGLAAMAGDDNAQLALAKNLSVSISEADIKRSWTKTKSAAPRKRAASLPEMGKEIPPSPLDDLPIELQMAGESIIEGQRSRKRRAETKPVIPIPKPIGPATQAILDEFERQTAATERETQAPAPYRPVLRIVEPEEVDEFDMDGDLPVLNESTLAKMLANIMANGVDLSSFLE